MTELLAAVRRHADAHADAHGIAPTGMAGMFAVRATEPSGLVHDIAQPMVCLLVQGAKRVTVGAEPHDFAAGDSLVVTADVPTVSRITRASDAAPYYSLVIALDPVVVAELAGGMAAPADADARTVRVEPTDREVAEAALRLLRLADRPDARAMLEPGLRRELHYWLLAGRHGGAIRRLGAIDGHAVRVARAVTLLRAEYDRPVPVARLAAAAGMSASTFHHHFRATTSLSPIAFQKHLRLVEARRLIQAEGQAATRAAFAVGYESASQFSRDYARLFGLPPGRDRRAARAAA